MPPSDRPSSTPVSNGRAMTRAAALAIQTSSLRISQPASSASSGTQVSARPTARPRTQDRCMSPGPVQSKNTCSPCPGRSRKRTVNTQAMVANSAASVRAILLGMTISTKSCSTSRRCGDVVSPEASSSSMPQPPRTGRRSTTRARAGRGTPRCGRRDTAPRRRRSNTGATTVKIAPLDSGLNVSP